MTVWSLKYLALLGQGELDVLCEWLVSREILEDPLTLSKWTNSSLRSNFCFCISRKRIVNKHDFYEHFLFLFIDSILTHLTREENWHHFLIYGIKTNPSSCNTISIPFDSHLFIIPS